MDTGRGAVSSKNGDPAKEPDGIGKGELPVLASSKTFDRGETATILGTEFCASAIWDTEVPSNAEWSRERAAQLRHQGAVARPELTKKVMKVAPPAGSMPSGGAPFPPRAGS